MTSALAFLEGSPIQPWRQRAFSVAFALFGLALFAATWKLWTPQSDFPQVPLIGWAGRLPQFLEWALCGILLVSLAASSFGQARRLPYVAFASTLLVLVCVNQHRLQPWAFQWAIVAVVLAALPPPRAFVLLRWLTVSIYFWSAIAKLDATFLSTLGQQFLGALMGFGGFSIEHWSPHTRNIAALAFPLAELLIAVGLALPLDRWTVARRAVLGFVVVMHVVLIALLSPLALNHQWGVLIWNSWFIVQTLLLFGFPVAVVQASRLSEQATPATSWCTELTEVAVELMIAVVIFAPALNLVERYDHWLAWGLYAPRNSRALLFVKRDDLDAIDPKYHKYLDLQSTDDWVQWRLDAWSLDALAVPIYPQDRFQLGVAEAAIARLVSGTGVPAVNVANTGKTPVPLRFRVVLESPADRWTGRRKQQTIADLRALRDAQSRYFFNAHAR